MMMSLIQPRRGGGILDVFVAPAGLAEESVRDRRQTQG